MVDDGFYQGYWEYNTPPKTSGKWDMYVKLCTDSWADYRIHLDPWWNSDWDYKKQITIDHTQIERTLKDFPVLIYRNSDSDLVAHAQNDLDDVVFTNNLEDTELDWELEYYDSITGEMWAWVEVPFVESGSDTTIYMYYGNGSATNHQDKTGTWESDFVSVYHMNESAGASMNESTSNNYDGTYVQTELPNQTTAQVKYGQQIEQSNDDYATAPVGICIPENGTFETWIKMTENHGLDQSIWYDRPNDNDYIVLTNIGANDTFYCYSKNGGAYEWKMYSSTHPQTDAAWHHIAITWENGAQRMVIDGVEEHQNTGATSTWTSNIFIGVSHIVTSPLDATLDETRFSQVARNNSWLEATYNTVNNKTTFCTFASEEEQDSVESPTGFAAITAANGNIDISWIAGVNSTHTVIEWNTSSSWSLGDGTLLYNDTGTSTSHTSLSCGTMYYYRAWGYNSTSNNFSGSVSTSNISCPGNPSGITTVQYPTALNITWVNNQYADNTTIVRKSGSLPTSPTDGTELFNGTTSDTSYNDTSWSNTYYYMMYSFNSTTGRFSEGVEAEYGSLTINVYNESDSSALTDWSVFISNSDGSQVYENISCVNPTTINLDNLPLGDISIYVNCTGYEARLYYMTLTAGTAYTLDAYLPHETVSNYYVIYVDDERGQPLDNVRVLIREYDDTDDTFNDVHDVYTDSNGQIGVYLIPDVHYKINLSKTGYISRIGEDYFPDPNYYGNYIDYWKRFTMYYTTSDVEFYSFDEIITFTGVMNTDGNITITYDDGVSRTIDTTIYIYEHYNSTNILNITDIRTGQNSFTFTYSNFNPIRSHLAIIYCNHSNLTNQPERVEIWIPPARNTTSADTIEQHWIDVFGDFELGWVRTFLVFIPCIFFLVVFGSQHVGLGILSSGLYLGFTTYFIGFSVETASFLAMAGLFVTVGIIWIIAKSGRDNI